MHLLYTPHRQQLSPALSCARSLRQYTFLTHQASLAIVPFWLWGDRTLAGGFLIEQTDMFQFLNVTSELYECGAITSNIARCHVLLIINILQIEEWYRWEKSLRLERKMIFLGGCYLLPPTRSEDFGHKHCFPFFAFHHNAYLTPVPWMHSAF